MRFRWFVPLAILPVMLVAVACGDDDDDDDPTATATTGATETVEATATTPATPSPAPTTDGTVAPGEGSTDPVTTDPMPDPLTTTPLLKDVRMGVHPESGGFDRIVFEFEGGLPPAQIEYVDSVAACGSGNAVELEGGAILSVRFDGAAAHNDAGQTTFGEQEIEGPGETIVEAKQWCDFEAVLGWAMGIEDEQNFKVLLLEDPYRLVIDVKH